MHLIMGRSEMMLNSKASSCVIIPTDRRCKSLCQSVAEHGGNQTHLIMGHGEMMLNLKVITYVIIQTDGRSRTLCQSLVEHRGN